MGQKVHPLGFRVGITKTHQSQWFARFNKYKYSQSILEDNMIRETLSKLFPELLNPILDNLASKKRGSTDKNSEEISITPRITQIKIERGLIPYEIGIQIHAENCELLKSAIDNLKVKRELIVKLQKTRRYLLNLKLKLKNLTNNSAVGTFDENISSTEIKTKKMVQNKENNFKKNELSTFGKETPSILKSKKIKSKVLPSIGYSILKEGKKNEEFQNSRNKSQANFSKTNGRGSFKFRTKLTKQELRRQRLIKKRLKKRQFIRSRYRQLILRSCGLFIKKAGATTKIIQTLSLLPGNQNQNFRSRRFSTTKTGSSQPRTGKVKTNFSSKKEISFAVGKRLPFGGKLAKQYLLQDINLKQNTRVALNDVQRENSTTQSSFAKVSAMTKLKKTFSSRIKKKFVTLFIQKMNTKFLAHLKVLLMNNLSKPVNTLPLGYNKQWSLNRLNKLKNQSVGMSQMMSLLQLNKMIVVLEQKLLIKLESLRKEFIAFGSISPQSSESLGYFQILNFLKNLKELVNKLKREQKLQLSISKNSDNFVSQVPMTGTNLKPGAVATRENVSFMRKGSTFSFSSGKSQEQSLLQPNRTETLYSPNALKSTIAFGENNITSFDKAAETILQKKLNNIEDECRKVKLIEYIKDIVKKHRTDNIYFYLSTMADAGKDLKKIKQFTKHHADFLFGQSINLNNLKGEKRPLVSESALSSVPAVYGDSLEKKMNERVSKVLEKAFKKNNFAGSCGEKTLQDVFLEQIEKQRTMCLENLQLTPKISIKFYAVNKKTLEQKASIVSGSVVDALEKRKAFRKVIKDAKETLMRTPGVKGVKIQVAGRLNGAEIARTEWVRAGRVPLQTLRANLDYSYRTANTIYGIIGVRVWIFKGYTKLISQTQKSE